jgi:hypothetical protein
MMEGPEQDNVALHQLLETQFQVVRSMEQAYMHLHGVSHNMRSNFAIIQCPLLRDSASDLVIVGGILSIGFRQLELEFRSKSMELGTAFEFEFFEQDQAAFGMIPNEKRYH